MAQHSEPWQRHGEACQRHQSRRPAWAAWTVLAWAVLAGAAVACGDDGLAGGSGQGAASDGANSDSAASDSAASDSAASDVAGETGDDAVAGDDLDATDDAGLAPDAALPPDGEAGPDAAPDPDGGMTADSAVAGDGGAAGDVATTQDGTATPDGTTTPDGGADPCPGCALGSQPPAPHPGAKGPLALAAAETIPYGKGFAESYKTMLVLRPSAPGVYPTVLFVHGKQLYEGGGFPGQLGQPYRAFLEHIASHGYVVAFVRVESGLLDADHVAMADRLLAAAKVLADKVTLSDPAKVAYVGHSMGAKVVMLAAWRATAADTAGEIPDPAAVFAYAVSNEPPPVGAFQNALDKVKLIPASAPTWFTLATGDDDSIAPWNDPKKPNAAALYAALATQKRQLLVVHGSGQGDPNPPTTPELVDDHSAPLSFNGKVGGLAGVATPPSYLDALDWYGFWKWTVGGLNYHFKGGDPKWAYGDLRGHGGKAASGTVHQHTVQQQGWTALPAP